MKLYIACLGILFPATTATTASQLASVKDKKPVPRNLEERIINGQDAPVGRYPYTVSLQDGNFHFCGSSLIAPDLVLGAAHCAPYANNGRMLSHDSNTRVVVNPHVLSNPIDESQVFGIEELVTHPLYETLSSHDHDFMVIKLDGNANLPYVRLNTNETSPYDNQSMQVMGWGNTELGQLSDTLQDVDVVYISNEVCSAASSKYEHSITADSLCAGGVNKGTCHGDSGGPLVIPGSNAGEDVQVGIVSWGGIVCAEANHPGVYARVEEEFDWIRFQVCSLSSNPPEYFRCDEGGVTFSPSPTESPTAPTVSPSPTGHETSVLVLLDLDQYAHETGWKIEDENGVVLEGVQPGGYDEYQDSSTVSTIVAVPRDIELKFMLLDTYGDGFSGRAVLYLGEEASNSKIVGYFNGLNGASAAFTEYGFSFTAGEDGILTNLFPTEAPSSPTAAPSDAEPAAPSVSPAPTSLTVTVLFELITDCYAEETGWFVSLGDEVVYDVEPDSYLSDFTLYSTVVLLARNGEYQLTLIDTFGDGLYGGNMTVYLGEEADDNMVLAHYDGYSSDFFSYNFTMDFTVSEDATISLFPTAAPTTDAPTTTAAPTPAPGPYTQCNVCGENKSVTILDAVWEYTTEISLRCGNVEANGAQGLISEDYCALLPPLLVDICGCEGGPLEPK